MFVSLDPTSAKSKINTPLEGLKSQSHLLWFDQDMLVSSVRLRGIECDAPIKLAEFFYVRKIVSCLDDPSAAHASD